MAGQGSAYYSQPHPREMFQSSQLPPPSQLHQLPPAHGYGVRAENELPPISASNRFPPGAYHPSLSQQQQQQQQQQQHQQHPWPTQRTSSSRDDRTYSPRDHDLAPPTPSSASAPPLPAKPERRDSTTDKAADEANLPSTSDFVKKLYKMLEDQSFQHVVSWGPQGDCFVVKDMNEFTKSILPRMFKHSNFASFVRQLNKYDFHKVKNTDDNAFGEHSWTFRHPDFHADRRDALENIKRKVPAARKSGRNSSTAAAASANARASTPPPSGATVEQLQSQVNRLLAVQDDMASHIRTLEANYQGVVNQMIIFQQDMARQDHISKMLITCYVNQNNTGDNNAAPKSPGAEPAEAPNQPPQANGFSAAAIDAAQTVFRNNIESRAPAPTNGDLARASFNQMNEVSRRAAALGISFAEAAAAAQAEQPQPQQPEPGGAEAQPPAQAQTQAKPRKSQRGQQKQQQQQQQQQDQDARPPPPPRPPSTARDIYAAAASLLAPQPGEIERPLSRAETLERLQELSTAGAGGPGSEPFLMPLAAADGGNGAHALAGLDLAQYGASMHEGLQVVTLGGLLPRADAGGEAGAGWTLDASSLPLTNFGADLFSSGFDGTWAAGMPEPPRPASSQNLRVRRSTYVPEWSVPPRVLLVEDDVVSRRISGKFLQVFGVSFDIAVDGLDAIQRLNLNKYDLVLMDIVMPKLDGVTATSIIRQSDRDTPIISMTSNSKPHDLLMYQSSGMNAHLPKPFTKSGLLNVLEKYIMNFQEMRQLGNPSHVLGLPPALGPSAMIEEQDDGETVPGTSSEAPGEQIDALGGDGFARLGEKRAREEDGEAGGSAGKRSRFELIE